MHIRARPLLPNAACVQRIILRGYSTVCRMHKIESDNEMWARATGVLSCVSASSLGPQASFTAPCVLKVGCLHVWTQQPSRRTFSARMNRSVVVGVVCALFLSLHRRCIFTCTTRPPLPLFASTAKFGKAQSESVERRST